MDAAVADAVTGAVADAVADVVAITRQQHSQHAPRPLAFCLHMLTQDLAWRIRICSVL